MKQLLILSGKGGTGKTTVASAFIQLAQARAFADCDVDAPNLHLAMIQTTEPKRTDYYGMPKAVVDATKCSACGACKINCRFQAISDENGFVMDPFSCEGCGVCEALCPSGAVSMHPLVAGEQMLYTDGGIVFSTAQLRMGSGTSGKLVSDVKRQMLSAASPAAELAVIDGSPGIGCPVIASLGGVSMALIVAEPSISGLSDLERIVRTAQIFHAPLAVCVNKADTNLEIAGRIERFCLERDLPFAGSIPFDPQAVTAINSGRTVAEVDCPAGRAVRAVYERVMRLLKEGPMAD